MVYGFIQKITLGWRNLGVRFHLYGTSLSGATVDEYAVTDRNGVAMFSNILISGP